jgi:hypothetical protein
MLLPLLAATERITRVCANAGTTRIHTLYGRAGIVWNAVGGVRLENRAGGCAPQ